ncbi:hypothetical protein OUZ56_010981 [Daphnia magna]|uniref:Uncharacterized protein n=1 Tax=Daphnia magna TaxID=35525 RepID=A0ABQ9YYY5_9CRUS|nr:hypothetical protein OUZ56_010981 [Daphnia magna]
MNRRASVSMLTAIFRSVLLDLVPPATPVQEDLIAADRGRVKTTISHMHSYSQMFLSPYGYTTDLPAEYPEMFRAMEIAVNDT